MGTEDPKTAQSRQSGPVRRLGSLVLLGLVTACAPARVERPVSWSAIAEAPRPAPDHVLFYGDAPQQFGELWLPAGDGPFPVVILLHGGCWLSDYDIGYMARAAADLADRGLAVWSLEYRRVGDVGGGWPGTFQDVARGADHLRALADHHPVDLERVVLAGHSAGGHLALWLASRQNLPLETRVSIDNPLPVHGVVALAGIADLSAYSDGGGGCNQAVIPLMGGAPGEVPLRYDEADPLRLLPTGIPTRFIQGGLDPIVPPEQPLRYTERAKARGDDAGTQIVDGEGHFDVADPTSASWAAALGAIEEILYLKAPVDPARRYGREKEHE